MVYHPHPLETVTTGPLHPHPRLGGAHPPHPPEWITLTGPPHPGRPHPGRWKILGPRRDPKRKDLPRRRAPVNPPSGDRFDLTWLSAWVQQQRREFMSPK